jgi:arginyl-tRNA--protein-N-Asp/Glu arginylyltransferase
MLNAYRVLQFIKKFFLRAQSGIFAVTPPRFAKSQSRLGFQRFGKNCVAVTCRHKKSGVSCECRHEKFPVTEPKRGVPCKQKNVAAWRQNDQFLQMVRVRVFVGYFLQV